MNEYKNREKELYTTLGFSGWCNAYKNSDKEETGQGQTINTNKPTSSKFMQYWMTGYLAHMSV